MPVSYTHLPLFEPQQGPDGYGGFGTRIFQAEDGIRDHCVTGVQTCALPILLVGDDTIRIFNNHLHSTAITVHDDKYPVSYTHLDVYKRQLRKWSSESNGRFRLTGAELLRRAQIGRASCRERV